MSEQETHGSRGCLTCVLRSSQRCLLNGQAFASGGDENIVDEQYRDKVLTSCLLAHADAQSCVSYRTAAAVTF